MSTLPLGPALYNTATGSVLANFPAPPAYPGYGFFPGAGALAGAPANDTVAINRFRAERHKDEGNRYRKLQLPYMAIAEYQKAVAVDPAYTDAHYNLGRTYIVIGDKPRAIAAFENLLRVNPADHEARIFLAEQLTQVGQLDAAKSHYRLILTQSPTYDPAMRNLRYLEALEASSRSPFAAQLKIQAAGNETLRQAKLLVKDYYQRRGDQYGLQVMERVRYEFTPTQQVNQVANLAEYDHIKGIVRFAPEMAFAHPNVLAAYLAHELVHARDNDPVSSIMEEQDGYRELARFWLMSKGQVAEPNLDLAASLYNESADKLDVKVRELYTMRDPLLPEKSPGHGMAYLNAPGAQAQAFEMEKISKYTQFVYDRIKSLLPAYGIL